MTSPDAVDPSDVHAPYVETLESDKDWASLVRYAIAHPYELAHGLPVPGEPIIRMWTPLAAEIAFSTINPIREN